MQYKQKILTALILVYSLITPTTSNEEKKNICLIPATYPWIFGPYQAQMHSLSLYLDSTNKYKNIYWLPRNHLLKLRKGIYKGWEEVRRGLLPQRTITPPADLKLDHLKFLGALPSRKITEDVRNTNMISASMLSAYAREYNIDVFVLLLDSLNYVPDTEFVNAAVLSWKPLHTEGLHIGMHDFWAVRNYHAVAALAPFAKKSIQKVITKENAIAGIPTYVDYVPHSINREELKEWASEGRTMVQSLLPNLDLSTFVVLIQGGNYDTLDRKGWNEAIQAYAIFRHSLPKDANVHLYLHSMESYLIEQDSNGGEQAPPGVLPLGVKLSQRLSQSGLLHQEDYTLDMTQHESSTVAALKQRSSLCLHASRAEGFGLNAVECQALGTPVVTTNYTAMKDYTKFGTSVHPDQYSFFDNYDLATPPVQKIADALKYYYQQHLDLLQGKMEAVIQRKNDVDEAREWIDTEFSFQSVGQRMEQMIQKALDVYTKRRQYQKILSPNSPPNYLTEPIYQIIQGEVIPADTNHQNAKPWILLLPDESILNLQLNYELLQNYAWSMTEPENSNVNVLCIPTLDNNVLIPIMENGGPNTKLPYLIRAHWFYKMSSMSHRRVSVIWQALMHTQEVKRLPDGLAVVLRKTDFGSQEL